MGSKYELDIRVGSNSKHILNMSAVSAIVVKLAMYTCYTVSVRCPKNVSRKEACHPQQRSSDTLNKDINHGLQHYVEHQCEQKYWILHFVYKQDPVATNEGED